MWNILTTNISRKKTRHRQNLNLLKWTRCEGHDAFQFPSPNSYTVTSSWGLDKRQPHWTRTTQHRIINVQVQIWILCGNVQNLSVNLNIFCGAGAHKSECTQVSFRSSLCFGPLSNTRNPCEGFGGHPGQCRPDAGNASRMHRVHGNESIFYNSYTTG